MINEDTNINNNRQKIRPRLLNLLKTGRIKTPLFLFLTVFALSLPVYADIPGRDSPGRDSREFPGVIQSGDLSIHFLELGNKYTGDCVYINYGSVDIIIDAGSRQSSAATIKKYIDTYIRDNRLEYVIATHAHEDHIAGFYSTKTVTGIFDAFEIGTIIDFPKTNSTTITYDNYRKNRDRAVEKGALHFDALQCFNNEGGARRIFNLGGNVRLEILYNYYYENHTGNENNYSVCARLIQNGSQYLFTGDLEADGEDKLVEYYEKYSDGLGHCVLYKGGHHGSDTSGGRKLLAAISPEYVCVCSCAGSSQYNAAPENVFPAQGFIDRIAPYTDRVYITTFVKDYRKNEYMPFNGTIVFIVSHGAVTVRCGNNDLKLKDSEWFGKNRRTPGAWARNELSGALPPASRLFD